ncbi:unnamed protein product, partial [Ectocarpus sp. 12 AP-2014]
SYVKKRNWTNCCARTIEVSSGHDSDMYEGYMVFLYVFYMYLLFHLAKKKETAVGSFVRVEGGCGAITVGGAESPSTASSTNFTARLAEQGGHIGSRITNKTG